MDKREFRTDYKIQDFLKNIINGFKLPFKSVLIIDINVFSYERMKSRNNEGTPDSFF